jgi:YD repeat-containing protein
MNAGTSLALTKTYVYNNRGNKIRETVSGYNLATATTSYGYSNDGKFQTSITDATGLRVTKGYDARFGTVTHLTDVNGLTTKWTYDGLGRKAKEERPDSTITKWHYAWYYNGKRIPHKYSITKYASGQPWQRVYYNSLGKDTITYKQTLNKKLVTNMKLYNAKGEVTKEALPYIADNESLRYIENSYDKFGRLIKIKRPIAEGKTGVETIDYRDFTTITTNVKGQRKETIKNAIGETLKVTDAYGTQFASSMTYTYDATGNLLETKDAHGNRVQMHYDSVGNKIYMNDPDLGIWNYRYAADGKVVNKWSGYKGIDSSKNYTYYMYDKLRRVTRISSSNRQEYLKNRYGVSFNSQIITYGGVYDAQGSRGKLIRHYGFSRYQGKDRQSERETLSYDSLGRLIKQDKYIYGRGNYITQTSYDHYSRPRQLIYPNGYRVNYSYSSEGILQFVSGERRTRWGGKIIYYIIKWRV